MNRFSTLTEALIQNVHPTAQISYVHSEHDLQAMNYDSLKERALGLLYYLQDAGVQKKDQLVLITQSNEAFLEGFWASIFGGIIAVPLSLGISTEHKWKLFRIWKQLDRPWIMLDQAQSIRLEKFTESNHLQTDWEQIRRRLIVTEQISGFLHQGRIESVSEEDTAFIQFSSGTTNNPKGVVLTHRNLMANIMGMGEGIKISPEDSTFSWMPLTHDMGLIGFHLTPLFFGIDQYIMPTEMFIRRPVLWMQKLSQYKTTLTCSPNFGYQHCLNAWSGHKEMTLDLSHVRLIFNGAEPISIPLIHRFLNAFSPYKLAPQSMFTVYGMAEASLAVAFPEAGKEFRYVTLNRNHLSLGATVLPEENGVPFAVEGKAVKGCQIRITADNGVLLRENRIGVIEIKGDNVTKGYWKLPEMNQQVIKDGWLNTGDLGFLTEENELVVTGRAKDIIFFNGQNYYPHDLEMIVEEELGVEKGKIAACGIRQPGDAEDQVLIFVLHKGNEENFYEQIQPIKRMLNERAGIAVNEVIPVPQFPKTTSGKIQRYLLGASYLNGEFKGVLEKIHAYLLSTNQSAGSSQNAVEQMLKNICDSLIPEKQIQLDDNIFEIGTTSIILAQLHQRIEETYPGILEVTDFFDYPTLKQLSAYIHSKQ